MVRRGRRRGGRRGASALRVLRTQLDGSAPRGRSDPGRIVANPWNSVTLIFRRLTEEGIKEFSVSSAYTALKSQCGLVGLTAPVAFRFQRVDVWLDSIIKDGSLAASNLGLLPEAIFSYTAGRTPFAWIEDVGTAVDPAHCHYVWPYNIQKLQILSDYNGGKTLIFSVDSATKNLGYTVHLSVLWRSNSADLVPSFRNLAIHE